MKIRSILIVTLLTMISIQKIYATKIVTIFDHDTSNCLSKKAEPIEITKAGLKEAKSIVKQLIDTLVPLMPAAGLAAPQIGISKQVFIFSWNRTAKNIQVVINPKIIEFSPDTYASWEACFSTMQENGPSKAAFLTRSNWIIVAYRNLDGKIVKQRLEGFAAKVFQHEYDHMQGVENTSKPGAKVKAFPTRAKLSEFMQKVKKDDSVYYVKPTIL